MALRLTRARRSEPDAGSWKPSRRGSATSACSLVFALLAGDAPNLVRILSRPMVCGSARKAEPPSSGSQLLC